MVHDSNLIKTGSETFIVEALNMIAVFFDNYIQL